MAGTTLPNVGLIGFWGLGEDLYKGAMDSNWLMLSVLVQGTAIATVNDTPGSPAEGDIYVLDETATEANAIAVFYGAAWHYFEPKPGWMMFDQDTDTYVRFDGTVWAEFDPALPPFDEDVAGWVVGVNADGTGYTLYDIAGSTGGGGYRETGRRFRVRTTSPGGDGGSAWGTIDFSDVNGFLLPPAGMIGASSWTPEHQPYMAIDGDPASYWSYDSGAETAIGSWWEMNFDNPTLVGYITLRPGLGQAGLSPTQFVVEYYSEIESDWIILGTYTTAWVTDDQQTFDVPLPPVVSGGGGIPEAPEDGNEYVRKDGAWVVASAGGNPIESLVFAASDESTALTAGTGKITFRMPYAFTLTGIKASLSEAQASGSILTVDVNEGGSSILSTKLTIDNTEKTSATAATAPVISDPNLADDAEITVDIDQLGDGTAKGLKIAFIGSRP